MENCFSSQYIKYGHEVSAFTHPEVVAHEAVNERVHERVGHGDSVTNEDTHVVNKAIGGPGATDEMPGERHN